MTNSIDLTSGPWYRGVRSHAIEGIIWDELDPGEERRGDDDFTAWDLITDEVTCGNDPAASSVLTIAEKAYDLGYRMAHRDINHL